MNIFRLNRQRGDEEELLNSIPGGFPTINVSNSSNNNTTQSQDVPPANNSTTSFLRIVLQIPLYILYYLVTIILTILSLLKPILNFNKLYAHCHRQYYDYNTNMKVLLDQISNEDVHNDLHLGSSNYTFGSVYNSETSVIPAQLIQNSYLALLENCSSECKFGLIYLHNPLLCDKMSYVKHILCSPRVINCIKSYQMLLWFGDVTTSEGLQVSNALKVRKFPYFGILSRRSNETAEIIFNFNGPIEEFNPRDLESVLVQKYPDLLQMIEQRQNIERDRLIRQQQDERFRQSLLHDQARERQRNEALRREQEQRDQELLKRQWLLWRKSQLHPEPTRSQAQDISRIAIKMNNFHNNSSRIVRNFDPTLPIEEIYAFVELTQNNIMESGDRYEYGDNPPNGYQHQYKFKLIIPVPRKELVPSTLIGNEPGIYPSGNIIVESI
ncbi:clathrin-mediated endocytosis regulator UBX3 PWA37_001303 [Arxiozyma heterogenica]|uniref:clathrin-mediated endocytosis regulator UBX3 n=1 Tax=Arxiozyma heterogenica TaxID=278026 RepID=UPI002EF7E65D